MPTRPIAGPCSGAGKSWKGESPQTCSRIRGADGRMRARIQRAFDGETSSTDAALIILPSGRADAERYWRSRISPLFGPGGSVTHVIQSGEDVTDEVMLRQQKDVIAAELEHRVRNTLAMVGSLAVVTGRHTPSVEACRNLHRPAGRDEPQLIMISTITGAACLSARLWNRNLRRSFPLRSAHFAGGAGVDPVRARPNGWR